MRKQSRPADCDQRLIEKSKCQYLEKFLEMCSIYYLYG